jgi:hypothetical protein
MRPVAQRRRIEAKIMLNVLIVAGAALLAWLYVSGVLTGRTSLSNRIRPRVPSIQKVDLNQYVSKPSDDAIRAGEQCRANLRAIEAAKRKAAERLNIGAGAVPRDEILSELGGRLPRCPSGGTYTIGPVGRMPTCSKTNAGTPQREDDHIILNW